MAIPPPLRVDTGLPPKDHQIRAAPLSELIDKEVTQEPEWIGPQVLPKRGTLLFGGAAAIGKSFVMLNFARALALGEIPFNDPVMTIEKPCRVLMIEQELGEFGLQKRVIPLFQGVDKELLARNLYYISKEPSLLLDTQAGVGAVKKLLDQVQPNVLIMDPVSWMHGYDENSNTDIAKLFHTFETLKRDYRHNNMSIIVSHHFGKPPKSDKDREGFDPLDAYNFRGAGKWKDAPDTRVTMYPHNVKLRPWKHWEIETRWVTRNSEGFADRHYMVNRLNDMRVTFKCESGGAPDKGDYGGPPMEPLRVKTTFDAPKSIDEQGREFRKAFL